MEVAKQEMQKQLAQQQVKIANVNEMEKLIKKMSLTEWDENYQVAVFYDVPESKEEKFLNNLHTAFNITKQDIQKIESMLFGAAAKHSVHKIKLNYGEFGGRYALFASYKMEDKFSILFADYTLGFKEQPMCTKEELRWVHGVLKPCVVDYHYLSPSKKDLVDDFFRYKALIAFKKEGYLSSIKTV